MLDLAEHYKKGPVQLGEIARRQEISVKFLEQLIIPLKRAKFIKSFRGPKGGHILAKPPSKITIGDIVRILEGDSGLCRCIGSPDSCHRSPNCVTRNIWKMAGDALYDKLDAFTLQELVHYS